MEFDEEVRFNGDITEENKVIFDVIFSPTSPDYKLLQNALHISDNIINDLKLSEDKTDLIYFYLNGILDLIRYNDHYVYDKYCQLPLNSQLFEIVQIDSAKSSYPFMIGENNPKDNLLLNLKLFWSLQFLFSLLERIENLKLIDKTNVVVLEQMENATMNSIIFIDNFHNISTNSNYIRRYSQILPFVWYHKQLINKLCMYIFLKAPSNQQVLVTLLLNLQTVIRKFTIDNEIYENILNIVYELIQFKTPNESIKFPLAHLMINLPNWNVEFISDCRGKEIESLSFLAPFLSGSMFAEDFNNVTNLIQKPLSGDQEFIESTPFLQNKLVNVWELQYNIVKLFLVEKSTQKPMIDWLSQILIINKTRGSIQPNEMIASGEGLLINVCAVLQRLVQPIKLDRVDLEYCSRFVNAIDKNEFHLGKLLSNETRVFMDSENVKERALTLTSDESQVNFHTQCFYLCCLAHNYGILGSLRKYNRRQSIINSLANSINTLSGSTLTRYQAMLQQQKRASLCSRLSLDHPTNLRLALEFYIQVARLITAQITNPTTTNEFGALPQMLFDDFADFLLHIINKQSTIVSFVSCHSYHLINFMLFVIINYHLFRSPYLAAKYIELIFSLQQSVNNNNSQLNKMLQEFCNHYSVTSGVLTSRLIEFYIYVEKTGASSEFYDKFSIRFRISVIFRSMWTQPNSLMKMQLLTEAQTKREQFVKFINRAMNDMVYLLDESITALKRIRTNQDKRNDAREWNSLSQQQQAHINQELAADERITRSQLTLADVTVKMLADFTKEIPEPFITPELVDKLASILNSLLTELAGPRCLELKVHDPDKYNWKPKQLLQSLIKIYLNLDSDKLVEAISNEERYYSNELFNQAYKRLTTYKIIPMHEAEHFEMIRQNVELKIRQRRELDQELEDEDIPGEFLDPIMNNLMREPVMLPQSKIIIDMSVIKRHLLNDDCDPFNRQPLKLDDLIPQPELKQRIQNWLIEKQEEIAKKHNQ